MNGPTHAIGGLLAGALVAHAVQTAPIVVTPQLTLPPAAVIGTGLLLALAGGLAPDRIQYNIPGRWPLENHRGFSHTLLFAVVTTLLFRSEFAAYWCAGLMSHLLLDVITVAGIPLFWPLHRRRVSLSLTTNGGLFEMVLRVALLVALIVMLVAPLIQEI